MSWKDEVRAKDFNRRLLSLEVVFDSDGVPNCSGDSCKQYQQPGICRLTRVNAGRGHVCRAAVAEMANLLDGHE